MDECYAIMLLWWWGSLLFNWSLVIQPFSEGLKIPASTGLFGSIEDYRTWYNSDPSLPHSVVIYIHVYHTKEFRPFRLQHLQYITGHRSLCQHALLLGNHRFTQLLTSIASPKNTLKTTNWCKTIYGNCGVSTRDCGVDWMLSESLGSEWPKSGISKIHSCQEG